MCSAPSGARAPVAWRAGIIRGKMPHAATLTDLPPFCVCFCRSVRLGGELTSVQTSQDSLFALVNHAPNVRRVLFL